MMGREYAKENQRNSEKGCGFPQNAGWPRLLVNLDREVTQGFWIDAGCHQGFLQADNPEESRNG